MPQAAVTLFLAQAKQLIAAGRIVFTDRQKNLATLTKLGLRYRHQIDMLLALTPQNYCGTLDPEDDANEDAWVFGVYERGLEIYIKFKIVSIPDRADLVMCVSFHEAEDPLTYPYRAQATAKGGQP